MHHPLRSVGKKQIKLEAARELMDLTLPGKEEQRLRPFAAPEDPRER